MSALTAAKGHICAFFIAYQHGEGSVLLTAVSARVISLLQNHLVLFTKHKSQSCFTPALYFCQWKMRLRAEECQHHHVPSTCPLHASLAFQALCTCSQRDEVAAFPWGNEWSFYGLSLTKALKRFCAQQIVLIAGKIDHSGTLMQPFYLQRKYKILFPLKSEESDNILFLCLQFQSF